MTFKTSISPKDKPTIETFHSLVSSILPPGIYQGGLVTPGGARSISVTAFVARAPQGGFTVSSDSTVTIALPTPTVETQYLLVVKSIPWQAGTVFDDHQISVELVEGVQNSVTHLWEPVPGYADAQYVLIFAKVRVDTPANQPQLLDTDIDTSIASTIDFQYQSGRVNLSGTGVYNGQQGAFITHNLGTTNYRVSITTTDLIPDAIGLGDVWVVKKPSYFVVYATSYIQGLSFDWTLTTAPDILSTPTGSGAYGTPIPQGPPGPAGTPGAPGAPGTPGASGTNWISGNYAPANTIGNNGDYFIQLLNGNVYSKALGVWTLQGNLRSASPDGPTILTVDPRSISPGVPYEVIMNLPSNRAYGVSVVVNGLGAGQTARVEMFGSGILGSFSNNLYTANMTSTNSVDQAQAWYYRDLTGDRKFRLRLTNTGVAPIVAGCVITTEAF